MKNFNYSLLNSLTEKLKIEVLGQYINKISFVSAFDFYFVLSRKNMGLFISLNNADPFIDIVDEKITLPKSEKESHLSTILRHHIEKSRIVDIELIKGQKVLKITVEKYYDNLTKKQLYLYFEFVVAHPNFIICEENMQILSLYRASKDFTGPRILRISQTYHLPIIKSPFTAEASVYQPSEATIQYLSIGALTIANHNHPKLFKLIKTTIKRLSVKKQKINEELLALVASETANLYGQLLLTYQPSIETDEIILDGVVINVNPQFDAVKNANVWFNKAKKNRQAHVSKLEQLALIDEELKYFQELETATKTYNDSELNEVEIELGLSQNRHKAKNQIPTFKPYYLTYKETKIGFGKNNLQNDYLTFKIANKSDTFLHINGQPGAHIIIFSEHPDQETLNFAGKLGLYLAKIPSGEFSVAKRKYVKKATFPGSVTIDKVSSLSLAADDKLIAQYLDKIKRF